jgi:uncharacterized protein (DUF1697 family)
MAVVVCLLRGVNVGGHNLIRMNALRALCTSLDLTNVQTYVQSGNILFQTSEQKLDRVSKRIAGAIEETFNLRCEVIVRTLGELRSVIERNPFAGRQGLEPAKLLVNFLASDPGPEAQRKVLQIETGPEEVRLDGREMYIYFPNGMGRSKLPWSALDRVLATPATGRNWNTVNKLVELGTQMETG